MKVSRELLLLRAQLSGDMPRELGFVYQPAGCISGLLVEFEVYRPDKTQDETQSGVAEEFGTTGRYLGKFTGAAGWFVLVHDSAGGKAAKYF